MTTSKVAKLFKETESRKKKERDNKGNKYNHRWIYGKIES